MPATADRGEIIHLAGRHRLSPAVRDGAPALVGPTELQGRCGWEQFFRALEDRGLAVAEEAGEIRIVARGGGRPAPRPSPAGLLAEARRFLRALRGRWTAPS
jgi:hypothetical protein